MKNKIFRYISFFAALIMILGACQKTDIQKANDDYDFDKVIPVVLGISGPTNATQTFSESYSPSYFRGGSTFSWSVSAGATITSTSADTRDIDVLFTEAGEVDITCTETTLGGVTSEPYTETITVAEFCPMSRDDFLGTWVGTESGKTSGDLTVTFIAGAADDEIIVEATAGIPAFMGGVFTGWGESFQAGFGDEGDIVIQVNANGSLGKNVRYWGQTLPGPWDYWTFNEGLWSGCGAAPTMDFDFALDWDGSGAYGYKNTIHLEKQ